MVQRVMRLLTVASALALVACGGSVTGNDDTSTPVRFAEVDCETNPDPELCEGGGGGGPIGSGPKFYAMQFFLAYPDKWDYFPYGVIRNSAFTYDIGLSGSATGAIHSVTVKWGNNTKEFALYSSGDGFSYTTSGGAGSLALKGKVTGSVASNVMLTCTSCP